jgi:hypothetical protein
LRLSRRKSWWFLKKSRFSWEGLAIRCRRNCWAGSNEARVPILATPLAGSSSAISCVVSVTLYGIGLMNCHIGVARTI